MAGPLDCCTRLDDDDAVARRPEDHLLPSHWLPVRPVRDRHRFYSCAYATAAVLLAAGLKIGRDENNSFCGLASYGLRSATTMAFFFSVMSS